MPKPKFGTMGSRRWLYGLAALQWGFVAPANLVKVLMNKASPMAHKFVAKEVCDDNEPPIIRHRSAGELQSRLLQNIAGWEDVGS